MASLLGDIGRAGQPLTRAVTGVSTLLSDVENRKTAEVNRNAVQAEGTRRATKFDQEQAQFKEKQEFLNRKTNIKFDPIFIQLKKPTQDRIIKAAKGSGVIDDKGDAVQRNLSRFWQRTLKGTNEIKFLNSMRNDEEAIFDVEMDKFQKMLADGKSTPEQIKAQRRIVDGAKTKAQGLLGVVDGQEKKLEQLQAAKKTTATSLEAFVDPKTGQFIGNLAKNDPRVKSGKAIKASSFATLKNANLREESITNLQIQREAINKNRSESLDLRQELKDIKLTGQKRDFGTNALEKFIADPTIRKSEQRQEFSELVLTLIESDNPVAHGSLATIFARASGEVGNLSEADKKPFGGSRALTARTEQSLQELFDGKKTDENIGFLSELAGLFSESAKRKRTELANVRAKQFAESSNGLITEQEMLQILLPNNEAIRTTTGGNRFTIKETP